MAWLYKLLDLQSATNLIGSIELATALALALGSFNRKIGIAGALGAIATFSITLTFLFSVPGWEAGLSGFPALSVVPGQLLVKDLVLLAASIFVLGKTLGDAD